MCGRILQLKVNRTNRVSAEVKKKIILLSIILFPGLVWYLFEISQANFKKMAYYGPKRIGLKGDTIYFTLPELTFDSCWAKRLTDKDRHGNGYSATDIDWKKIEIDTNRFPVYCILFINPALKESGFKLSGLFDFVQYKREALSKIPLFFISPALDPLQNEMPHGALGPLRGLFDSIPVHLPSFIPLRLATSDRDSFLKATYFNLKPVHVFDYFIVLIDKSRHIRGFYDPAFNSEIKRMSEEFMHLKLRDGYAETLSKNEIRQGK